MDSRPNTKVQPLVPLLQGDITEGTRWRVTVVKDENIDMPKSFMNFSDQSLNVFNLCHIADKAYHLTPSLLLDFCGGSSDAFLVAGANRHSRPFGCQRFSASPP
jgi:hypothetical protein